MGVVLKDHLALGRQVFHLLEYRVGAISDPLGLIPLGCIRHQHLKPLQPVKRHAQGIPGQRQHRARPRRVFLLTCSCRQRRREDLATRRAA